MSFLELLSIVLGATGLFASVLGAFLTYASRSNGEATRALIRSMEERTTAILLRMEENQQRMEEHTTAILLRMEENQQRMEERTTGIMQGMDQRADERHRDTIEAIRTLRT